MGSNSTVGENTVFAVFWSPTGFATPFSATYKSLIDRYLTDVATASGTPGNVYAADTQYYGTGGSAHKIRYDVHFGGEVDVSTNFPAGGLNGCTPDVAHGFTACVTDAQLQSELSSVLSSQHDVADLSHVYLVYFPPNVETCFDSSQSECSAGATNGDYCGYHSNTSSNPPLLYANMPYPVVHDCQTVQGPNGDPAADAAIDVTSHEHNETITDPEGTAWLDNGGNEIGDECNFIFGTTTPLGSGELNQTINGHNYLTQEEFSNQAYTFDHGGCIQSQQQPVASFTAPTPTEIGQSVSFNATATSDLNHTGSLTYSWNFGDGSPAGSGVTTSHAYPNPGTYTVTLTVTDGNGWVSSPVTHQVVVQSTPGPPSGVQAAAGNATVVVSWSATFGASSYSVFDATTSGGENVAGTPACTATSPTITCTVSGLSNGTQYFFVVRASNTHGASPSSPEVSATPLAVPQAPPPPSGSVSSASASSALSSGTATASNAGTSVSAAGLGALTVAQYGADPVGAPNFSASGEYFDVHLASGSSFSSVTITDCNLSGGQSLSWWNPAGASGAGAWQNVVGSPGPTYSAGPPACVSTVLGPASSPSLSQMTGTVFGVVLPPTPPAPAPSPPSPVPVPSPTGSASGSGPTAPGPGYWLVGTDGGIFSFGSAGFYGSMGGQPLNEPIVGMTSTADGYGYLEVASDGGIFAFGDANFYGSMGGRPLNRPIVAMATTPDGQGYWLVASDGGIFAFGDAGFFGSTGGTQLNAPVVGMSATPDGRGYQEVTQDGGIFAFGDAGFFGSMGGGGLNAPIVALAVPAGGAGYWEAATDGGIFGFGSAPFLGSMGAVRLNAPIVAIAAVR